MNLVSIDPQQMLSAAQNSLRYRLQNSLYSQGMKEIPATHPTLPEVVKKTIQWAQWERVLVQHSSPNNLLFLVIMVGMGLYYQTLLWLIIGLCSAIALTFGVVAKMVDRPQWAQQHLQAFLHTPFLFLFQDTLYENLPRLRQLDSDILRLTNTKQQARSIQQQVESLTRQLKEKLVLLGESTSDQQIMELEVAQITQEKIISKAEQLLTECQRQRQQQERTRTEIIQRLELHVLRQKATKITGTTAVSEQLTLLTDLEMQATSLSTEMSQVQGELDSLNLKWKNLVNA